MAAKEYSENYSGSISGKRVFGHMMSLGISIILIMATLTLAIFYIIVFAIEELMACIRVVVSRTRGRE